MSKKQKKRGFFSKLFGGSKNEISGPPVSLEEWQKSNEESPLEEEVEEVSETEEIEEESVEEVLVEESNTNIPGPKNIINREPFFVKEIDIKEYCDELYQYLQDFGLSVHKRNIRQIFAAIAANKVIVLKNEDSSISERFVEVFTDFIGAKYFSNSLKREVNTFSDMFFDEFSLKDCLYSASNNLNRLHFVGLGNVELEKLELFYDTVLEYSWNPELPCDIENTYYDTVKEMPLNMWFFVYPKDNKDVYESKIYSRSTIVVDLNASIATPKDEVYNNQKQLSYEFLTNLYYEGYEQFFIEETDWKKLDKVEEYLTEYSDFKLDNRLFRQMERYTSILIMFGGDQYEAMDDILYAKFLRVVLNLEINADQNSENGLFQLFEKHFGLENLFKSKNILKIIQESNKEDN